MLVQDERRQIIGQRVGVMAMVETGGELTPEIEDSGGRAGHPSSLRECVTQIRRRILLATGADVIQPGNALTERTDRAIGEMRGSSQVPTKPGSLRRQRVAGYLGMSGTRGNSVQRSIKT
jgi:hypothetical protein